MMSPISITRRLTRPRESDGDQPDSETWGTALIWVACRPCSSHRKSGNARLPPWASVF
jgi:hypothetical protein